MIAASALYLVGGLVTGCAPDLVVLIIGRLIYGIGIGMVSAKDWLLFLFLHRLLY